MIDRGFVEKAAEAGVGKVSLLREDPLRYMLRAIGAGMGLTLVVFVFWTLKQNLRESAAGAIIASGFFGVGLVIIVFTNTELFTSNNMYLTVSSAEGRTSWKQAAVLWISCYFGNLAGAVLLTALLIGAGSLDQLPPDHALFNGASHKGAPGSRRHLLQGDFSQLDCLSGGSDSTSLQGRGCQDTSRHSDRVYLRLSRIRALDRQYGDVLNGDLWRRRRDDGRCFA
jgi:formate/nitrite transporter FocA (FNT family)